MEAKTIRNGIIALIVANVIWGFASPVFKWSLGSIPPYTLAFLRFFFGSILMVAFLGKRARFPITDGYHDALLLVLYAASGIVMNIAFFLLGLQRTLSMNGPIIASAAPVLTFVFAMVLLKETFHVRKFLGMLVGTVGIAAIVLEPLFTSGLGNGHSILGNLYLVIATLGGVIGTIVGRKLFLRHDPLTLMTWSFIIGAAIFFPLATDEFVSTPDLLLRLTDVKSLVGIGFGAIFSSAVAYGCFAWGLSKIPASEATLFTYIDPIAGTILSYFWLKEPLTVPFLIGTILIFGGIFIAEGRLHYHPIHKLQQYGKPTKAP